MSYRVDFFADVNKDGKYDPPTNPADVKGTIQDHSWRRTITGATAGVTESFKHDSNWTNIAPF